MTLQKKNNIAQNIDFRLSVQVSLTGLSFLVINSEAQEVVFFTEKKFNTARTPEDLLAEIETVISEAEALRSSFKDVSIIFTNRIYTVVPASLFEESKVSEYLKFNSKILSNDFIAHDRLDQFGIVVVYVPFVNINNYFFDRFGSFQYYHGASIFIKNVLTAEKHSLSPKVFLHVQSDQFDCIIVKNGALELCNTYSYKTPADLVYYVLFCLEQLNLNPDTVPLTLCGDIDEDDENYKLLYTYIRHITFLENPEAPYIRITSAADHKNYLIKSNY
jgi:hypothetical protein